MKKIVKCNKVGKNQWRKWQSNERKVELEKILKKWHQSKMEQKLKRFNIDKSRTKRTIVTKMMRKIVNYNRNMKKWKTNIEKDDNKSNIVGNQEEKYQRKWEK